MRCVRSEGESGSRAGDKKGLQIMPHGGTSARLPDYPYRVMESNRAGDVLVHKRQQCRMVAVQRFNDWTGPWYSSVSEYRSSGVD